NNEQPFGKRPTLLHLLERGEPRPVVPSACGLDEIYHLKRLSIYLFYFMPYPNICKEFFYCAVYVSIPW
nr:hypothetical protein [Schwartzia sp. (in: firmicutes)]